ncbi:hypothetical protein STENM36S_06265 [Streptomyces tendae]
MPGELNPWEASMVDAQVVSMIPEMNGTTHALRAYLHGEIRRQCPRETRA